MRTISHNQGDIMGTRYEYESAIDFSQLPKFLASSAL
jgi:hypothetical protein